MIKPIPTRTEKIEKIKADILNSFLFAEAIVNTTVATTKRINASLKANPRAVLVANESETLKNVSA